MLSDEEKKAIERIEDFLTTNIIISISNDETANSEELKALISKNEYLSIEFIAAMFLKQSKEMEELNKSDASKEQSSMNYYNLYKELVDKIKAKIEEYRHKDFIKMQVVMKHDKEALKIAEVLQSLLEKEWI